ncbi:MAG: acyl-CoA dehydrogenase family protein [Micrococcales bacterium]|nr:acyl-CoA dehydrogenase family protein [Micrococcales bacterium]
MHRTLSEEDAAFQQRMRDFFTTEVPQDIRDRWRAGGEVEAQDVRVTQRILNAAGLAVPSWPREFGGQDWTNLQLHIYLQEMQSASVPPPLAFNVNMVGPVIAAFASRELKERFLSPTANLDIWWAQGFSEPEAGSDLASLRTSAVLEGDEWVVNGQKTWTTLGQHADWIFALVRTDPDAPKKQMGISFLLIDMATPGVTVRPIQLIDRGHEVNEIFFDNVRVPVDQLVGEVNKGWDYAKFLLGNERVSVAPVGSIKRKLADAKGFARSVATDDGTLLDDVHIATRFAELEAQVMALELTALRVAAGSKDGKPDPASSILKLRGSQLQQDVLELVVDLAGPSGLLWDAGDTRDGTDGSGREAWTGKAAPTYLNFRKASIYGGSNEVQRQIISSGILGLRG